jgi:hypothetical protein
MDKLRPTGGSILNALGSLPGTGLDRKIFLFIYSDLLALHSGQCPKPNKCRSGRWWYEEENVLPKFLGSLPNQTMGTE